jgi:purine-nucleoside phosphorylase
MENSNTLGKIDQTVEYILTHMDYRPKISIILGSGLGDLADSTQEANVIPYAEIPNWPRTTVQGHLGKLVISLLENKPIMIMQGRIHYYEGYDMAQIGFPVRVMQRLGVNILIVTNAAGAINPDFQPGDLMLIKDHINLIGMAGLNPLRGPNLDAFGPRFPDMSQAYDRELIKIAESVAEEEIIQVQHGTYVCLAGPSFETPADLRFLRVIGADAVGMSTVPEVITARHSSMRVLGISGISNKANLDGNTITTHEEVLEAGLKMVPKLTNLVSGILRRI